MSRLPALLLIALGFAIVLPGAAGQQSDGPAKPAHDYHILPINGDLAAVLKEQLLSIKDLSQLPLAKKLANADPKQIEAITKKFKELHQPPPPVAKKAESHVPEPPPKDDGQEPPTPPPPVKDNAAEVEKMTKNVMDWLENTQVADLDNKTRESPAYRRFKERVLNSGHFDKALANIDWTGAGGKGIFPDLGWLKLPSIAPSGGLPRLPPFDDFSGLRALQPYGPALPGTTSLLRMLLTAAVAVAVAVIAWVVLGRRDARPLAPAPATLGPWPVEPGRIATAQQLVLAFEYLALVILGSQARAANHRAIAARLGTTPDRARAADYLAALYETIRYNPATPSLAPPELAAAARNLCLLADLPDNAPALGAG